MYFYISENKIQISLQIQKQSNMTQPPYFLEKVAQRLLKRIESDKKVAVILPNRRPAIYIRQYIAKHISEPLFLPDIITIEDFFFKVTGLLKADYTQQLIYLYQAYKKANIGDDTIEDLLSWAPTFIADCNDIDNSVVDPDYFFNVLFDEKELRNWNLGEELTEMQKNYLAFWRQAPQLYKAFTDILLEHKSTYSGLSYRIGVQQLEKEWNPPYDHMIFAGFNALNNAEEKLIDLALQNDAGEIMWDLDGYYVEDDLLKAGHYFRKYIDKWNITAQLPKITGYRNEKINVIKAPNTVGQTDAIYNLIMKQCEEMTQKELVSTAIILCDETLLEPTLLRLPSKYTYNITMGKPLKSFGQYHLFDNLINIYQEKRKWSSKYQIGGFTSTSVLNLANSPFIDILDFDGTSKKIQRFIIENNQYYISPEEVSNLYTSEKDIWHLILNCASQPISILELGLEIIRRLRAHYLDNDDRSNIEVLYEYRNILINLINIGREYPDILTLNTVRKLYHRVVAPAKLPYEGEPIEGIQIMGLLESRALDFEYIILVSANESILPESKTSQSFIPHIFKEHFGMPTYNERDAIFAYSFYRLLHHAKKIDILYSGGEKDLYGGEMSRYVAQILSEYNDKAIRPTKIGTYDSVFEEANQPEITPYIIPKNETVLGALNTFIREKTFSPSSLNLLLKSPLDFYFAKIARVKEAIKLESEMEANTFGTIVHNTLEELYKPYIRKELTLSILADIEKKLHRELANQFAQEFKGGNLARGQNYLLREAAEIMVKEAIKNDKKRVENHRIAILSLEEEVLSEMTLDINGTPMIIRLRGKVDRIQQIDDKIEIIDYKSGRVDYLKSSKIETVGSYENNDKLLQLMTYAHMTTNRKEGKSYPLSKIRPALQPLKAWQNGLIYIENEDYEISEENMETFINNLSESFSILLDKENPFAPEKQEKRTKYSVYKPIWEVQKKKPVDY